jgi:hypothetical protein
MTIPFLKTAQNLTIVWNGRTKVVPVGTAAYDEVIKLIKANADPNIILASCDLAERVKLKCHTSGLFATDDDNNVWVGNEKCPKALSDRIVDFVEQGLPFEPLIKFWNNCVANPDSRARTDLFAFLEHNGHPITEDGCFIAYRKVTEDFKDHRTKSMDNRVGQTVRMERSQCNSNPNETCSAGLHVAAIGYAWGFANGHTVCVKVNPKDVVAIPVDYNQQKMRCCEFTVLAIHESEKPVQAPLVDDTMKPKTRNDYDDYSDGGGEDFNEDADAILWDSRHAASKPIAVKCSTQVKNKGWQNLRDSKGRFYRKHI